jgi:hypothetical protein
LTNVDAAAKQGRIAVDDADSKGDDLLSDPGLIIQVLHESLPAKGFARIWEAETKETGIVSLKPSMKEW